MLNQRHSKRSTEGSPNSHFKHFIVQQYYKIAQKVCLFSFCFCDVYTYSNHKI